MNDPNVLLKQNFIMFDFKTALPVFKDKRPLKQQNDKHSLAPFRPMSRPLT